MSFSPLARLNGRGEGGEGKYWDPQKDKRLTAWDPAQYPIRALDKESEQGAGVLYAGGRLAQVERACPAASHPAGNSFLKVFQGVYSCYTFCGLCITNGDVYDPSRF
jgi:hypothetical protein